MLGFLALFTAIASHVGDIGKGIHAVEFLFTAITEAEATGQTGEQKLAAVLNSFEAFLVTDFPDLAKPFEDIAPAIESIVNLMVQGFNMFAKPAAKV